MVVPSTGPLLLSIDGKNLATRAGAWAQRMTPNPTAQLPEAVGRMFHTILGLLTTYRPTAVFIAWDHGRSAHRRRLYPDYKANHDNKSPSQLALGELVDRLIQGIHTLHGLLPIYQAQVHDCEADDLIALSTRTLSTQHLLFSTDGDYLQLLSPRIQLYDPHTRTHMNEEMMLKTHTLSPTQWLDYKILIGDAGDNVPGLRGLGPKTAKALLQRYGTLEAILADRATAATISHRAKVLLHPDTNALIERNRALMSLHELPDEHLLRTHLPFTQPHSHPRFDVHACLDALRQLGCTNLMASKTTWEGSFHALADTTKQLPPPPLV